MFFQEKKYSCGAASIRAILSIVGINVSEEEVRLVSNTTKEGADEYDLGRALTYYGLEHTHLECYSGEYSWRKLRKRLNEGYAVVCCVDKWTHWIGTIGVLGPKVVVFDPAFGDGSRETPEGTVVYSKEDFHQIWKILILTL
jgi:ABC-type bacteriocin/lantibiotic exporter with double-glycine peptidase domain